MRRQGGGHIVNTASLAGLLPFPFQALYCTSKRAVVGMSESMRFEFAEEGIHFSVVCPSNVASAIWNKPIIGSSDEKIKSPEDAIPAEQAAQDILTGVANKKGIIVVPEDQVWQWRDYWRDPKSGESRLLQMAHDTWTEFFNDPSSTYYQKGRKS